MKHVTQAIYFKNSEGECIARLTLDYGQYEIKLEYMKDEVRTTYINQRFDNFILARANELYESYKWLYAKLLNVKEFTEQIITHEIVTNHQYKE